MITVRERKHRLLPEFYCGKVIVSFTASIREKLPCLNDKLTFQHLSELLFDALTHWNCDAHVFLFMPDHCHLLLEGREEDSDLLRFMKEFKQRSGYWFSKSMSTLKPIRLQKDFYDHILRKDEDIQKHVFYILENPIRKGLVASWKEYPFKGSTLYNFDEW